jgi:DNA-binding transcriptional ArsR family regulator
VAEPRRRALLNRLAQGPATAGQLAAIVPDVSRAASSQHLAVLREAGLVRATSSGRHVWYELAAGPVVEAERWLAGLVERWTDAPTLRLDRPGKETDARARVLR